MKYSTKRKIRRILFAVILILLFITVVMVLINGGMNKSDSIEDTVVMLQADSISDVYAFELGILSLQGTKLTAITHKGEGIFADELPVGDYKLAGSSTMVIAYSKHDLIILNSKGESLFTQTIPDEILSVKCGNYMYAITSLVENQYRINIYDLDGNTIGDTLLYPYQSVLSTGWYGDDNEQIWTLALDSHGTLPESRVVTYHPGKSMTGFISLADEIAYLCLPSKNALYTIGTRILGGYSYSGENFYEKLIYGWALEDMALKDEDNAEFLLAPVDSSETGEPLSMLWYINTNGLEYRISLPSECKSAKLYKDKILVINDKGLYIMNLDGTKSEFYKLNFVVDEIGAYTKEGALALSDIDGYSYFIPAN